MVRIQRHEAAEVRPAPPLPIALPCQPYDHRNDEFVQAGDLYAKVMTD